MESVRQEITALVGREVYTTNGVYIGEIENLQLDLDREQVTNLALGEVNKDLFGDVLGDARGIMIPYRMVRGVGDAVIVADAVERIQTDDE